MGHLLPRLDPQFSGVSFGLAERGPDERVLLHGVDLVGTNGRTGALGPPNVGERGTFGEQVDDLGGDERPRSHVHWLLLDPGDLADSRVARQNLFNLVGWKWIQLFDANNCHVGCLLPRRAAGEIDVYVAGAQYQAGDFAGPGSRDWVVEDETKHTLRQLVDRRGGQWVA
jgi:hypothetical protein